jgi:hypothetical protein
MNCEYCNDKEEFCEDGQWYVCKCIDESMKEIEMK